MSARPKKQDQDQDQDQTQPAEEGNPAVEEDYEVSPEPEEGETRREQNKLKKYRQKIKQLRDDKKQALDELQRQKAEFLNARKRDEERQKEEIALANERLILELLPVVDSFEMAFADQEAYEQTPENWRRGVEYIYSQLLSTLEQYGVRQLHPVNEAFDPRYHEAVEQVEVAESAKDGAVVKTIQKGYLLNDKVIRSAKVQVGYHSSRQAAEEKEAGGEE